MRVKQEKNSRRGVGEDEAIAAVTARRLCFIRGGFVQCYLLINWSLWKMKNEELGMKNGWARGCDKLEFRGVISGE
jgi:hypothetical protein